MNFADLSLIALSSVEEALELVEIRNECRHMMTNCRDEISGEEQKKWFLEKYLTQPSPLSYQVWLLKEYNQKILGYFAVKTEGNSCFITEGIRTSFRGQGLGSFMLSTFRENEVFRNKEIFADILNANYASISLHKKFGFTKHSEVNPETSRYILVC